MGCDIHGWVEKKVNDKWIGYRELEDRSRFYPRFAALAGVRGVGPEALGLPGDISETARLHADEDGDDGHSHSYIPLRDAFKIFDEHRYKNGDQYSPYTAFGIYEDKLEDYRLVFWFDN